MRDSAGVRIVESLSTERYPAPVTLGSGPTFQVGVRAGEATQMLDRVVGATRLDYGVVVIANRGTNELWFYRPSGEFLHREGGGGEGPGEFEYLRALGRCRDGGFTAFDLNWQMAGYDSEGQFIDERVVQFPGGSSPYRLACDRDGRLLVMGWGLEDGPPKIGFSRATDRLLLLTAGGEIETDFGERLASERIGSQYGSRPHPAGRATVFDLYDGRVYVGSGEGFEIEVRGLDGELQSLIRGPDISLESTDSIRTAWLEGTLAGAPPERAAAIRRDAAGWEWPGTVPAFTDLIVDSRGTAWAKAFRAMPSEPERWSLLDPQKGYLGDLTLDPGQEVLEIGDDYLLLLERDELDVERVLMVALNRGSDA